VVLVTVRLEAVTGTVYDLAAPTYASSLALGNLRVGATPVALAVTNTVTTSADYQDKLAIVATGTGLTLTNPTAITAGTAGNVGIVAAAAGSWWAT